MMKTLFSVLIVLALSETLTAEELVSVPWTEFRELYRDRIERDIMSRQKMPEKASPMTYSLDEAGYRVDVAAKNAEGEILISGKLISGDPSPIPLFGTDVVVTCAGRIVGGSLISEWNDSAGVFFLPDGRRKDFQIMLSFLARPQEDSRSRFVSFGIPPALKNWVNLTLSPEMSLVDEPGIADRNGVYRFSATTSLAVRFQEKKNVSATSFVDLDTFSRIRIQGKRAMITTAILPVQPVSESIVLNVWKDAQYAASSLNGSWIRQRPDDSYEIALPAAYKEVFTIQFTIEEADESGGFLFSLPSIEANSGREGDFVLEEPDDGRIELAAEGLVTDVPVARLNARLAAAAGAAGFCSHVFPRHEIKMNVTRFRSINTPPIILDSLQFFSSFEENGSVLSVLLMDIPPEIGPRMELKAIPGAEIWSLMVNDRTRRVYGSDADKWIIPLEGGKISRVRLAFLRQGAKLGLQGRLDAAVPETGLPSRSVCVGIALPERVQLLSLEGPVNPATAPSFGTPAEFVGRPYYFSRAFYKGEGMALAVSYKEPVKQAGGMPVSQQ